MQRLRLLRAEALRRPLSFTMVKRGTLRARIEALGTWRDRRGAPHHPMDLVANDTDVP
jgi:hypothetical protein